MNRLFRVMLPLVLLILTLGASQLPALAYTQLPFTYLVSPFNYQGPTAKPYGLNNAGAVVGGFQNENNETQGFLFRQGIFIALPAPVSGATDTYAQGINDSGQIVGRYTDPQGQIHGFRFDADGYTNL